MAQAMLEGQCIFGKYCRNPCREHPDASIILANDEFAQMWNETRQQYRLRTIELNAKITHQLREVSATVRGLEQRARGLEEESQRLRTMREDVQLEQLFNNRTLEKFHKRRQQLIVQALQLDEANPYVLREDLIEDEHQVPAVLDAGLRTPWQICQERVAPGVEGEPAADPEEGQQQEEQEEDDRETPEEEERRVSAAASEGEEE